MYMKVRPFLLLGIVLVGMTMILLFILNSKNVSVYNFNKNYLPYVRLVSFSIFSTGLAYIILSLNALIGKDRKPEEEATKKRPDRFRLMLKALVFSALLLLILGICLENISNVESKVFLMRNIYWAILLLFPANFLYFYVIANKGLK